MNRDSLILSCLRSEPMAFERLRAEAGLTECDVRSAVESLRSLGYVINERGGVLSLTASPDRLLPDEIRAQLSTRWLGETLACFGSLASTMDVARRLARGGAPDGTVVTAERQTAGRGRAGRSWASPSGLGIWCSILFPSAQGISPGALSLIVAAGVAAAMRAYGARGVALKWPNDVVVRTDGGEFSESQRRRAAPAPPARKLSGILVEAAHENAPSRARERWIVGCGVNVGHRAWDFPAELRERATSLFLSQAGRRARATDLRRASVLARILREVEHRFDVARFGNESDGAALVAEWNGLSLINGRRVRVVQGNREFCARALEIRPDGALLVDTGTERRPLYGASVSLHMAEHGERRIPPG